MKKKFLAMATATAMLLGILAGCGGNTNAASTNEGDSAEQATEQKDLYFIPLVETGAYWSQMIKGAQDKADELGYNLILRTSPSTEPQKNERHLGFVDEALNNGAAGVAIAPNEPNMFDPKLKALKDQGIPVVTFDGDVATEANRDAYVGTDNKSAGEKLGVEGAKCLKEKGVTSGSIALVACNLTQTTFIDRYEGIKAGFAKEMGADAENFTWLEPIQDNDQSAESKRQLEAQLVANTDMVAVFSLGSEGPDVGTMEALKSQGKAGTVLHFGFDYTPTWENGVEAGLITGIVNQDSYAIGATCVEILDKRIKGEQVDSRYPIDVNWVPADEIVALGDAME